MSRATSAPNTCEITTHPAFDSPDADVALVSKDLTRFCVHSFTLKTTSGWFRSLFTLPRPTPSSSDGSATSSKVPLAPSSAAPETIHLAEDSQTLEIVLRMIGGFPITPITSYDIIDAILFASEKYDMPGPASLVRIALMTPPLADQPLRLYAAASRFGWTEEAQAAAQRSLALNLWTEENWNMLNKVEARAALALLKLHRTRREQLQKKLEEHPFVGRNAPLLCPRCRKQADHHTWRELKYRIILEVDERPLGDTVLTIGLQEWPEAKACWETYCLNPACTSVVYDKTESIRLIKDCIDSLPKSL